MTTPIHETHELHTLRRELEGVRARLIDAPELNEPWRRRARLVVELLAFAQGATDGLPRAVREPATAAR
jgi:hypothetical protein